MLRVRRRLELPQRTNLQPADALPGISSQTPAVGRILEVRKTETTAVAVGNRVAPVPPLRSVRAR